jgi:hypothetical protein
MYKKGYTLLIEIDENKSLIKNGNVLPENTYKTGRAVYIKNEALQRIFGMILKTNFTFINEGAYNKLVQNNL